MLNDKPSLPSPKEWATICAESLVKHGVSIKRPQSVTVVKETVESQRHENRILEEMRRLGAKEE